MTTTTRNLAILGLLLPAAACQPYDRDEVQRVAVHGDAMVVTGQTLTEGGFGCGGFDEGPAVTFHSDDAGATFTRSVPDDERPVRDLVTSGDQFLALHSDWDGHVLRTSSDGQTWTDVTSGDTDASDLLVHAGRVYIAHGGGLRISTPGPLGATTTWTDVTVDAAGLYLPRLAAVGDALVLTTNSGTAAWSTDGVTWTTGLLPEGFSVHGLTAVAGRAVASAHGENVDGVYGPYLLAFAPTDPAGAIAIAVPEEGLAIIDAPIGALLGDGSLAPADDLDARAAHADGFLAGAVDGDTLALLHADGVSLSRDGGGSFAATAALPLIAR